jgi:TolA-binding protein
LAAFQRLVDKYPQSRKLPDALLKIGYCDYELKQWGRTGRALAGGIAYSDTPAGQLGAAAPRENGGREALSGENA